MQSVLLSIEGKDKLRQTKIAIVGCGGLGGIVIEGLIRSGAKNLLIIDYDKFAVSNINRQFFSTKYNIDSYKVYEIKQDLFIRFGLIADVKAEKVTKSNIDKILAGSEIVFDCVDNIKTKLLLEEYCISKGVPLIHGAVADFCGQVAIIKDKPILSTIYATSKESNSKNDFFAVAMVASAQIALLYSYIQGNVEFNTVNIIDVKRLHVDKLKI